MNLNDLWDLLRSKLSQTVLTQKNNKAICYLLPFLLTILIFLIKNILGDIIGSDTPFLFFTMATVISAWYGGFGPGLLSTFLTGIAANYFLTPDNPFFTPQDLIRTGIFFIEGFSISLVSEALKQAENQKNEFISLTNHELKTPLTVIRGYSELINQQASNNNEKASLYSFRIINEVSHLENMVNDLLDINRIEIGHFNCNDSEFEIYDLLKEKVYEQNLTTKNSKIVLKGKSKKMVVADKYRIGQVFNNLLNNAIKYSPHHKIIQVYIKNNRGGVTIEVKDHGSGISKNDQAKIFRRFYRSKEQIKTQGLGVGLYISKIIIDKYRGKIQVKSSLEKGSTFSVFLPSIMPKNTNSNDS